MTSTLAEFPCVARGTCCRLPVFQEIAGLKRHAMRTARRHGLKVRYVNGMAFVVGDDFLDYLDAMDQLSAAGK